MKLNDQEQTVLAALTAAGVPDLGARPGDILRATVGLPHRVWSVQQAGRVAMRLVDLGYARVTALPQRNYYRPSGMGWGYLTVPYPDEPVKIDGRPLRITEGDIGAWAGEAEEGYDPASLAPVLCASCGLPVVGYARGKHREPLCHSDERRCYRDYVARSYQLP